MEDSLNLQKQKELQEQKLEQQEQSLHVTEHAQMDVTETQSTQNAKRLNKLKDSMQDCCEDFRKEWSKQDVKAENSWSATGRAMVKNWWPSLNIEYSNSYSLQTFALGTETMKQEKRSGTALDLMDNLNEWHKMTKEKDGMPSPEESVDRLFELSMSASNYYVTHQKKHFYSAKGKGRQLVAKKAQQMTRNMIEKLLTDEEKDEIKKQVFNPDEGVDYEEGETDKSITKEVKKAAEAYRKYRIHLAENATGALPGEILERKLRALKVIDRKLKKYIEKHRHEEDRDPLINDMIKDYLECLSWKKLFSVTGKTKEKEESLDGMIEAHLVKEGEMESLEKTKLVAKDEKEELKPEQLKGIEEIDNWLLRNFQNGGISGALASSEKNKNGEFVTRALSMTKRERLHMYYLVEKKRRKEANITDVGMSQNYVPNLKAFKNQMIATKFKFWKRVNGEYTYMYKLDEAFHATTQYRTEINAVAGVALEQKNMVQNKDATKQKEAPSDAATQRYVKMMELGAALQEYIKNLETAKKATKKQKKGAEQVCKESAALCESLMKEIEKLDGKVGKEARYTRPNEYGETLVNDAVSNYKSIGELPKAGIQLAAGAGLYFEAKWDLLGAGWSKANLWAGSATHAAAGAAALLGMVTSAITLCRVGNQMSGAEISEKVLEMSKGFITIGKSLTNIGLLMATGGNMLLMESKEVLAVTAASGELAGVAGVVVDTGIMVARAVGAGKMRYHGKKAQNFFTEKRKEMLKKEGQDQLSAEKKRELKYEQNMMKLQKDLEARERNKAIFSGVGVGLSAAGLVIPVFGVAAAVVSIIGSIKDYVDVQNLRNKLFDNFFNMDELVKQVIDKRYGRRKYPHANDNLDEKVRESLRNRVAAYAGFSSMKTASEFICSKFAGLIRQKLFGENTSEEEKKGYIQFVKAINLRVNLKKKLPTEQMLVRKMSAQ